MNFRINAKRVAIAACLLLVVGCGNDGNESSVDDCQFDVEPFFAGMVASGDRFDVALMESLPAPPAKGDNVWSLGVTDSAGAPRTNLELSVIPYMPLHNHGTPIEAAVTEGDDPGTYGAEPVNLWMPGLWDVTVELDDGSGTIDSVVFSFCIDG